MNKVLSFIRSTPKRALAFTALAVASVAVPAAVFAWGPERPTYTIAHPADHITFNSITDNPNLGDERNFTSVRELGTTGTWKDAVNVEAGKTYEVRVYVHNNAADNLNLVAKDVTAKVNVPTTTAKSVRVMGWVSSSNATPTEVYDQADFNSTNDFNLAYVAGSAKYYNNVFGKYDTGTGTKLPDSLVTSTGAKLGYDKLDGNIPGCFQYAGVVVFHVKPQFPTKSADFTVQKQVRKEGVSTWTETAKVSAGDTVNYRLVFTNSGQTQLNNVMLKDQLPANVTFVPGTVRILNAANPNGAFVKDGDKLVTDGVNIGSYTGGGSNAIVVFQAKVAAEAKLKCGTNTLVNTMFATPEGQSPKQDTADVTVDKVCEDTPEVPVTPETPETPTTPETPEEVPAELPETGVAGLSAALGLGSLVAATRYYITSRRAL